MHEDRVEKVPLSCAQCRRKKSKCDRQKPCGACTKSRLSCSYETVSRTPLTRRHLSVVESELARAKARLREYEDLNTPTHDRSDSTSSPSQVIRTRETTSGTSVSVANRPGRLVQSPVQSLETPPAGDFDWDERAVRADQNRNGDGMASLAERNGYMGVTSGTALLRMARENSEEPAQVETLHSMEATPPIPALYSLAQLEPFVDAYFRTYHSSYPIVHEPTFRAQFMEIIPRPHGKSWHFLLHIVAAIGCFAASETIPEADVGLFMAAKARMSIDLLETGNITLVQALTLTSNYVQKRNRPNSGYNYMGLAKRMAFGLALHKEFPNWQDKPFQLELRRRVWWCLYIFDVGAIITFSRPLDMPADGIEVTLPLNINDGDITPSTTGVSREAEETTLYTHVRCQAQFHLATNGIYQQLISTIPAAEQMLELDNVYLQRWLSGLPVYFNEHSIQNARFRLCHAILQWRWRNFRILMFRPFMMRRYMKHAASARQSEQLQQTRAELHAIQKCLDTARESIYLISVYWTEGTQNVLSSWYGLYFLFQAVLIPVVCLRNDSYCELAPSWRDDILVALNTMTDMNRLNPAASRCHDAVIKLCGAYLAMDISQWESPTNESPQTQMNTLYSYMFGPITDDQLFNPDVSMDFMAQLGAP